jgi:hypothetical protein
VAGSESLGALVFSGRLVHLAGSTGLDSSRRTPPCWALPLVAPSPCIRRAQSSRSPAGSALQRTMRFCPRSPASAASSLPRLASFKAAPASFRQVARSWLDWPLRQTALLLIALLGRRQFAARRGRGADHEQGECGGQSQRRRAQGMRRGFHEVLLGCPTDASPRRGHASSRAIGSCRSRCRSHRRRPRHRRFRARCRL